MATENTGTPLPMTPEEKGRALVQMRDGMRNRIDQGRQKASLRLKDASRNVETLGEKVSDGLHRASLALENASGYLAERDLSAIGEDTRQVIRRHPGKSIVVGVVLGLLVGRLLRMR